MAHCWYCPKGSSACVASSCSVMVNPLGVVLPWKGAGMPWLHAWAWHCG
jgi:hypothetical protein